MRAVNDGFPAAERLSPQCEPRFLGHEHRPRNLEHYPRDPERHPRDPERHPRDPERRPRDPERRPHDPEHCLRDLEWSFLDTETPFRLARSVNFYNKQHRKLSDTVYYCCQSAEQLDKQIRLLTQQTIVLKNLGKQKKGIFALPQVFCWSAFYQVPRLNDKPMASGVFRLHIDHGLQNCFETVAGMGLAGMKADRDEKHNGLSLVWAVPALVLAGVLMLKAPMLMAKVLSGATIGAAEVAAESYKLSNVVTNKIAETPGLFASANSDTGRTNVFPKARHAQTVQKDSEPKRTKSF